MLFKTDFDSSFTVDSWKQRYLLCANYLQRDFLCMCGMCVCVYQEKRSKNRTWILSSGGVYIFLPSIFFNTAMTKCHLCMSDSNRTRNQWKSHELANPSWWCHVNISVCRNEEQDLTCSNILVHVQNVCC